MAQHGGFPFFNDVTNIDNNVRRPEFLGNGVEIQRGNGVRGGAFQRKTFEEFQASVARKAAGVADQLADNGVVRMLILAGVWREHDGGLRFADLDGQLKRVLRGTEQMAIASEIEKVDVGANELRGGPSFGFARLGSAVRTGLAAREDQELDVVALAHFPDQDVRAAKFDVKIGRAHV